MNRDVREQSSVVLVQRSLTVAARKIDGDDELQAMANAGRHTHSAVARLMSNDTSFNNS